MYYLVDLKENKTIPFNSKLDLLYYRFSEPEHHPCGGLLTKSSLG